MELDEWTAAAVDPGEGAPDPDEWIDVGVPGSPARFEGERAIAYRTRFPDPGGPRARLSLRGLYAHARVWLNGEFVGSHDTSFTPFETMFDPEEENELVVECRTPEDRFGGVFETPLIPSEESVPAIRWGASVESVPEITLTDLTVRPDAVSAGINAIVTVDAGVDVNERIRLSLHPAGEKGASALSQVGVTAAAGERVTVQGRLSVRDPGRWWPRGIGPQDRYTVRAALGESERRATTGFRTVEHKSEGLFVNGTRVPVRGRVALPASDPERAVKTIERAVETNATLVRLYGHVPPESVYEAAAESGILLWQDVPMNPGALDVERARTVARRLAGEYGHHPSLALFGVHDDAYEFDATSEEDGRRVCRATSGGERATSASAAASAVPGEVPAVAVSNLDTGMDGAQDWVVDGYAGSDADFDAGAHTRYVVSGTDTAAATRAKRAIEGRRCRGTEFVTAFAPPGAVAAEESIATAFEPVGVFLDDPTATRPEVVVINDTMDGVSGEIDWSAGTESGTLSVDIGPTSQATVGRIEVGSAASTIDLSVPDWGFETRYRL